MGPKFSDSRDSVFIFGSKSVLLRTRNLKNDINHNHCFVVTEELTLETVAPVTTGEENSLTLPSSSLRERGRGVAVEDPVIISAVSNKCPSQSQVRRSYESYDSDVISFMDLDCKLISLPSP